MQCYTGRPLLCEGKRKSCLETKSVSISFCLPSLSVVLNYLPHFFCFTYPFLFSLFCNFYSFNNEICINTTGRTRKQRQNFEVIICIYEQVCEEIHDCEGNILCVIPYSPAEGYRRFRTTCCFHLQELHLITALIKPHFANYEA